VTRATLVTPTTRTPQFAGLGAALIIAVGYYLGARLGFALTLAPVPVSTLWPPNALLMAGLVLVPARRWPLVFAFVFSAHLIVQFQSGVPATMVLSWFLSNCSEALIGAGLLRRFGHGGRSFDSFRGTLVFLACAGVAAPVLSSFLDAGLVTWNGWGDSGFWRVWRTRVGSNVLAAITLVPVILTTFDALSHRLRPDARTVAKVSAGMAVLIGVCWFVFVQYRPAPALLYTPVPLLVLAAVRFGPLGASVSILACALVAIWGAVLGRGPFVASSALENAYSIQSFLIVAWIPIMSLAAVMRERVQAESNARLSEAQLTIAIEAAQLGRWEWDIESGRLTWSDITRRLYEVSREETVTPETLERLIHPDDRALVASATVDALAGRDVDVEFRVRMPDGRVKWILSRGRTVFEDGRAVRMVGVKVDVSARRSADLQIQEQRRLLAQLSRASVAGELSVAFSHEMNQPLAAILTNAGAARRSLLNDPPDLGEIGEILEAIADDNRRAASIVKRFGTLLAQRENRPRAVDVNEIAAGVASLARPDTISRGVSLTTRFAPSLPPVIGDAIQLQQVLLNLIVNGCDAMESLPPEARRLTLTTTSDDGWVRLTVADNGPGVPPERIGEIFEPFVSTKAQRLGLGLAICRSIVSAHDGQVWVETAPGGGAVFSVALPAVVQIRRSASATAPADPPSARAPRANPPASSPSRGRGAP
jgi:PAS domain S-box-containing protein